MTATDSRLSAAKAAAPPQPSGDDASPRRRKPVIRPVTVRSIEELGPRMRRVTFAGESLEGFASPRPGAHIKLLFGEIPVDWQPGSDQPRPTARTYTPRHYDPVRRELVVDFVRHGQGVASDWVEQAQIGSAMLVAGPGGGQIFPADLRHLVLFADESALPAAGMILDSLPADCLVTVFAEVEDAADQYGFSGRTSAGIQWLARSESNAAPGKLLLQAARNLDLPESGMCWVACEATAMREIKGVLLSEHNLRRERLITRGYWKAGASDHPDHDMGE